MNYIHYYIIKSCTIYVNIIKFNFRNFSCISSKFGDNNYNCYTYLQKFNEILFVIK